jgi:Zn-dependent protease
VNFSNLRPRKLGMALVALAGPVSNYCLAILFALVIRFGLANSISEPILIEAILVNLILGTFNLIPIPPLDGSKVIASFLPDEWLPKLFSWERWGFALVLLFLLMGWLQIILMPVLNIFSRVFGINFGL